MHMGSESLPFEEPLPLTVNLPIVTPGIRLANADVGPLQCLASRAFTRPTSVCVVVLADMRTRPTPPVGWKVPRPIEAKDRIVLAGRFACDRPDFQPQEPLIDDASDENLTRGLREENGDHRRHGRQCPAHTSPHAREHWFRVAPRIAHHVKMSPRHQPVVHGASFLCVDHRVGVANEVPFD